MASGVKRGTSTYTRCDRVGTVSPSAVPSSITRGFSTDVNDDGRLDVLFPRGDGELLLLLNQPGDEGRPGFVASLARGAPTDAVELGVGKFGPEAHNRLVWIDPRGNLFAATLTFGGDGLQVGKAERLLEIGPGGASRGRSIPWSFHRRHHRRPPAPAWGRSHVTHRARHAPRRA